MNPLSISRLIFDTVPQFYEANGGKHAVNLEINGENNQIFTLVPLSPSLRNYLEQAVEIWKEISPMTEGDITQVIEREWIQQKFVVNWLESQTKVKSWGALLDYGRRLSRRRTENQMMTKTIVVEAGKSDVGRIKLSDPDFLKVFDWLGSSAETHTFFRVNEDLGIIAYEALPVMEAQAPGSFRFYPDCLHSVISSLKDSDAVILHLSSNGSLFIADRRGIIASKRTLESWTIYDIDHVLASVAEALRPQLQENACKSKPTYVASSLFQILFDVMMKRHGALIILDDPEGLPKYVIKGIERFTDSSLSVIFSRLSKNELLYSVPEVRKLVELSAIDGAVILDLHGNLLQVGSMIVAHSSAPNRFGTREAAGFSAAKHGATAFKVSADGHMSMFFRTPEFTGEDVQRFDFR